MVAGMLAGSTGLGAGIWLPAGPPYPGTVLTASPWVSALSRFRRESLRAGIRPTL